MYNTYTRILQRYNLCCRRNEIRETRESKQVHTCDKRIEDCSPTGHMYTMTLKTDYRQKHKKKLVNSYFALRTSDETVEDCDFGWGHIETDYEDE